MSALSEQKNTLLENLQIPPEERRLSHVLPSLKGPHQVGRSSIIIQVPENYPANCNKEIGIEIFAPIRDECTKKVLLEMIKDNFKRIKGMRFEDIKKAGGDTSTLSRPKLNKEQIQTLHTNSSDRLDSVEAWPIVIFSHGLRLDPTVYRPLVEELASHGYIVLNLNHPASSSRAPFSKEALDIKVWDKLETSAKEEFEKNVENNEKLNEIFKEMDVIEEDMVAKETNNIRFIIEQIRNGNLNGLPKECGNETQSF